MTTLAPAFPVSFTVPAPLLERAAELETIAGAVRRLEHGIGGVVVLEAAAGLGKTALLDEAAQLAANGLVRRAAPGPLERHFCFGLIRTLLEGLAREHPSDGAAAPARDLLLGHTTPACDATMLIAHSVLWLCEGLGPLTLLVDDAQWADQPSLDVLAYLARRIDDLPLLLIVASRSATALRSATVLHPQPLTPAGSARLIRRGNPFATDAECVEFHAAAEGNPWLLTSGTDGVRRRLAELSAGDRAVAEALAVVGDGAEPFVTAAVAGVPIAELGAARDALAAAGLLRGTRFAHDLIADAITDELPQAHRERLHREAARALSDEPAVAASHLLATSPQADPEVSRLLRRAAAGATHAAAAAYLERALQERAPGDDRAALLTQLATAAFDAGLPDARRRLEHALDGGACRVAVLTRLAALGADDPELFDRELAAEPDPGARLAIEVAALDTLLHRPAERARRLAALESDDPLLSRVLLAHRAWAGVERGTPKASACAALALRAIDGRLLLAEAQQRAAYMLAMRTLVLTDHRDAPFAVEALQDEAIRRGSVRMRVAAARCAAELALRRGRIAEAETHARLALDLAPGDDGARDVLAAALAERGAFPEVHELMPVAGARLWLAEGEYEQAYAAAGEQDRVTASLALSHLGRREEAAASARTGLELAERFGAPRPIAAALVALAVAMPEPDVRAALSRRALALAPDGLEGVQARIELGSALGALDRRLEARDVLRPALAEADAAGATRLADRARRELVASGARPRHSALEGPEALTPRQREICALAAAGRSNRAIAQELFLSIKTVETHLAAGYRKLGVNSRAELSF